MEPINKEEVIRLYKSGMSTLEVAEHLGRPRNVRYVQTIVKKAGITRSISEARINAIARGRMVYPKPTETRKRYRLFIPARLRAQVMLRDGYKCVQCARTAQDDRLEVDHINNDPSDNRLPNLRVLCQTCNLGKEALYKQQLAATGLQRPRPANGPRRYDETRYIVLCGGCDEVTRVHRDRSGMFCSGCFRMVTEPPI